MIRPLLAALALALSACVPTLPPTQAAAPAPRAPVTILVSIDGFRSDYLERGVTPTLSRLAAQGASAAMRPSFPSKTFPNHYAIVTGLRPDRNGIVANRMEDPRRPGETFTMASDDPFWWNEATPIWVDAERAGIRTATMFWPGANVAHGALADAKAPRNPVGGTRPSDWHHYNEAVTASQRVDAVIDWLRRPAATRPRFLTLYFEAVDTAGHDFGPDDTRTTATVAEVDRQIAALVAGLADLGQPANLVIVSDHGMAATSSERVVTLHSLATPGDYRVIESGPYAALAAVPGREAALEARLLGRHPHATCWRKGAIPARFHYGANPRVPAYLCLADSGWLLLDQPPKAPFMGGNHGYDPAVPEMAALFIANGPAFQARTLPPFDNVAVHALLRDLIGLPFASGKDGDGAVFRDGLAKCGSAGPAAGTPDRSC